MDSLKLSLEELDGWIPDLVGKFSDKQIVLLKGTLGAGKTELVRKVLLHLGSDEASSPTYSIINKYEKLTKENVHHVDLYRIDGDEDLESVGFWDIFDSQTGLIFIEWADKIPRSQYPEHWNVLEINILKSKEDSTRTYEIL